MIETIPSDVATVIDSYPADTRAGVLALRALILSTADMPVTEALRWGQPAYLTAKGTTLRLGPHKQARFALFAHCQSTVISAYAAAFPGWDKIDGNRAVLFDSPDQIEPERLSKLIGHALLYHVKNT